MVIGFAGCYTVPRHLAKEEIIIYYYEPEYVYIEPVGGPWPVPDPPTHITNPIINNPSPPRDRQPEKPQDNYGKRDPLQGGDHRDPGGIKTYPPVKTPKQNDRVQ